MPTETHSRATADGYKAVRGVLEGVKLRLVFRASGYKSSEGDGRTAADIRRELAERTGDTDGSE